MLDKNKEANIRGTDSRKITELDLYAMSKESLIKKIQIMIHQLKVVHRMNEQQSRTMSNREQAEREVVIQSLTNNQEQLKNQLVSLQKQLEKSNSELKRKDEEIQKQMKQNTLLKKKIDFLYKNKAKDQLNTQKEKQLHKQQLQVENTRLKKQIKALNVKVKILEELNNQTQLKLSDTIINNKSRIPTIHKEQLEKENDPKVMNVSNQKKVKMQVMSLKEQTRQLRERLRVSEEEKQLLKSKIQQRQLFYSKMISSRH